MENKSNLKRIKEGCKGTEITARIDKLFAAHYINQLILFDPTMGSRDVIAYYVVTFCLLTLGIFVVLVYTCD